MPGFPAWAGAGAANVACFVGSWFFTSAAAMQLASTRRVVAPLEWASAAVQFVGTVLFNVSTGAAVWAHVVAEERRFVWTPDAAGSVAFLVSGVLAMTAVTATAGLLALRSWAWVAAALNLIGCIAFGISAAAAFIRQSGVTADERLANLGTFVGALCFLVAALVTLPRATRTG
ncbi:YrhK family protein [Mycobacterium sp. SMC-4]|uniref:YrhK family protein n=1 Tax=Mycobacterium sp. SMC-4 TaxID=2857059 RepID=UPI0021B315FD|nr:YrhK family protein [Mycobacterium sp. SMC-4]